MKHFSGIIFKIQKCIFLEIIWHVNTRYFSQKLQMGVENEIRRVQRYLCVNLSKSARIQLQNSGVRSEQRTLKFAAEYKRLD